MGWLQFPTANLHEKLEFYKFVPSCPLPPPLPRASSQTGTDLAPNRIADAFTVIDSAARGGDGDGNVLAGLMKIQD